jgi:hypothetical protein
MTKNALPSYGGTYARFLKFAEAPVTQTSLTMGSGSGLELLRLESSDSVQLMLADPAGRRTGVDPVTGIGRQEIPESSFNDELTVNDETGLQVGPRTRSIEVLLPSDGSYTLIARAAPGGAYALETISYDRDGEQRRDYRSRTIGASEVAVTTIDYSASAGGSTIVTDGPACMALSGSPTVSVATATVSWTPVTNASGYDLVRGSLAMLRSSGDFGAATAGCVASNVAATSVAFAANPSSADGVWFLARARNCAGPASYDGGTHLLASRDPGIGAAASACP